jgi:hypothetical protein
VRRGPAKRNESELQEKDGTSRSAPGWRAVDHA